MKLNKNQIRVARKINKFFERHKVAYFYKVSQGMFEHVEHAKFIINLMNERRLSDHKGVKNIKYEIGQTEYDFIQNNKTVRLEFTCAKYGNL